MHVKGTVMEMQSRVQRGNSLASDGLSRRAAVRWIGSGGLAATMALLGPGREGAAASVAENEEIARRLVEALNSRQLDAIDDVVADDVLIHVSLPLLPPEVRGWAENKQHLAAIVTAIPDATLTLDEVIAAEDRFALRVTFVGNHTGDVLEIASTGKAVSITGIYLAHVADGKIVEAWLLYSAPPWVQLIGQTEEAAVNEAVAANEAIGRGLVEALNAGAFDAFPAFLGDDMVIHVTPQPLLPSDVRGRDEVMRYLELFVSALPGGTTTLDDLFATDDGFAIRVTFTGTHTGDASGISATGKEVTISTLYLARTENGQIIEAWLYYVMSEWADLLIRGGNANVVAAPATPVVAGTLDEVLTLPGVVAALEFAEDGTLGEYRSKIDVPVAEFEQTAELIGTATTFLPALLARYSELSSLEWDAPRWLVYSSDAWTAVLSGNRAVLAETATVDFNQLYSALAGAR